MNAQFYFDEAKRIWSPFNIWRIIPLCTPVCNRPPALVIGTNHSVFTVGVTLQNDGIGELLESRVPTINTYTDHDHTFARGLRESCLQAGINVGFDWVGSNRCSVQTGARGIGVLKNHPDFMECQGEMDTLLKALIDSICPKNVILAGSYAIDLYYPNRTENIESLECRFLTSDSSGQKIKVIPILHPSMSYHRERVSTKLDQCFLRD